MDHGEEMYPASAGEEFDSWVREDRTCGGATKRVYHDVLGLCSGAWEPEPIKAHVLQLPKPVHARDCACKAGKPPEQEAQALPLEKGLRGSEDPVQPKKINNI